MTGLELAQKIVSGESPQPPIARLLGFTLDEVSPGRAVITLQAERRHASPLGTLHGGVLCDISDAAMGIAFVSTLKDGETFTTLELKINFLRPFWEGRLTAIGTVTERGSTVGLATCDVTDERGRLIAHATSTCMALRGEKAAGRRVGEAAAGD